MAAIYICHKCKKHIVTNSTRDHLYILRICKKCRSDKIIEDYKKSQTKEEVKWK